MEQYIKTMKELTDRLAAINAQISAPDCNIARMPFILLFHSGDSSGGQRCHHLKICSASTNLRETEAER